MDEAGAYGERLRKTFKIETAPFFVAKTLTNARIAVTEIRCEKENAGLTEPIPVEDSFLLTIQLRDVAAHGMFLDGREVPTSYLKAGTANFYDLRSSPMANSVSAFHHVSFYVPRAAFLAIAEKEGITAADAFNQNPGVGVADPTLHNLARAIAPCFRDPRLANPLFVDHVAVAATAHAVKNHACNTRCKARAPRLLSGRETAHATERLAEHLDGGIRLDELSADSAISPLDFAIAFENSVGSSIHAWRRGLRAERARKLLSRGYDVEAVAKLLRYDNVAEFADDFVRSHGIAPRNLAPN
ncbi:helix-turn-helix transcriptional regulator [Mesorhizobium sp. CU2]|uniref:helix-turn-helix domain-containing protein n=1 Tax=unclassified Mesorhizobium TaxID=325217 RepID=UPI00112EDF37|nr:MULTISPECIES: helix-turn-helix domain-containing protein [unclassified Mesorhizobium]TPN83331.1 helix-turn-helix transcriptional regulator [Mesorhizobium sp. CU3]TPO15905.1 helix-turn-helix transcriptional regulator [Mesorhizobium sp. CU2]